MKKTRKTIMAVLLLVVMAVPFQPAWGADEVSADASVVSANVKDADTNISWDEFATKIKLNGSAATVDGSGATANDSIVTITQEGDYIVSGSLTDGQIAIAATSSDKVHLILNGVDITNKTGAPIYASQCDKLIITLVEGTQNTLTDGNENFQYADLANEEPNAALFSKDDLTINGTGNLTVTAGFNNGIGTKDDLLIISGSITINAENHGLRGNDSVTVIGGVFNITSGNDGIQTNNTGDAEKGYVLIEGGTFNITSNNDGVQADTVITIKDGSFNMVTGGGNEAAIVKTSDTGPGMRQDKGLMAGGGMPPNQPNTEFTGKDRGFNMRPGSGVPPTGTQGSGKDMKPDMSFVADGDMQPNQTNTANAGTLNTTIGATSTDTSESYKGLKAGTGISITGGKFNINSADDSIHSNSSIAISGGSFELTSGDDAVHADGDLTISGSPEINISTSYEGLEANTMTIAGGVIIIVASDDGINISGGNDTSGMGRFGQDSFSLGGDRWLKITGGTITITAEHDGIDINGGGEMTGGVVNITAATSGEGDTIDSDSIFLRTGGTLTETGGSQMGGRGGRKMQ